MTMKVDEFEHTIQENKNGDVCFTVELPRAAYEYLCALIDTGLFGAEIHSAGERLICRSLLDISSNAGLPQPTDEEE